MHAQGSLARAGHAARGPAARAQCARSVPASRASGGAPACAPRQHARARRHLERGLRSRALRGARASRSHRAARPRRAARRAGQRAPGRARRQRRARSARRSISISSTTLEALVQTHVVRLAQRGASDGGGGRRRQRDRRRDRVRSAAPTGATPRSRARSISCAPSGSRARRSSRSSMRARSSAASRRWRCSPTCPPISAAAAHAANGLVGPMTWSPENFDGTFVGPVSAREALAGSLNVPAVRVAAELGAREVVATLRNVGLSLPDGHERYGLSIALGSGEVTPLELAEAYVTLARGGEHVKLRERATDARLPLPSACSTPLRWRRSPTRSPIRSLASAACARAARSSSAIPSPSRPARAPRFATRGRRASRASARSWCGSATRAARATNKLTGAVGAGPLFFDAMKRAMDDVRVEGSALRARPARRGRRVPPLRPAREPRLLRSRAAAVPARATRPSHACNLHQFAVARDAPAGEPPWRCDPEGTQRVVLLPAQFQSWLAERPLRRARRRRPRRAVVPGLTRARVCRAGCRGATHRRALSARRRGACRPIARAGASHDAIDVAAETHGLSAGGAARGGHRRPRRFSSRDALSHARRRRTRRSRRRGPSRRRTHCGCARSRADQRAVSRSPQANPARLATMPRGPSPQVPIVLLAPAP